MTNAEFSGELWGDIACLKSGRALASNSAKKQLEYLKTWCMEEKVEVEDIFLLIEFRAATNDLPAQTWFCIRAVAHGTLYCNDLDPRAGYLPIGESEIKHSQLAAIE